MILANLMVKFSLFVTWRYMKGRGGSLLSVNARLSFIGVFVGTSLLVVVLSIFNGFQMQLKKSIFQFDPHITLSIERTTGPEKITNWEKWKRELSEKMGKNIISAEGMIQSPAILRRKSNIDHVFIRGMEFPANQNHYLVPSHFPKMTEPANAESFRKGAYVLIGKEMALNLGVGVGDTLELIVPRGQFSLKVGVTPSIKAYKVAGLFKTGHYQYDSKVVILPLEESQKLFEIGATVQSIILRLSDINDLQVARMMAGRIWPFSMRTLEDEQRNFFAALRLEKTIMTTIVFLFILAAMVGIIVATYNVIRSRRRDIGVLKALGMAPGNILIIFTLTGFVMGILGTICGILAGISLSVNLESIINFIELLINIIGKFYTESLGSGIWFPVHLIPREVYYFDHLPIAIDRPFLHTLAIISMVLAGLASLVPARYASRLEPIHIIRTAEG